MLGIKEKLLSGELPEQALGALASMTFPLPVEEFLDLFPVVYGMGDEGIQGAVITSITEIPSSTVDEFLMHVQDVETLIFYYELFTSVPSENSDQFLMDILRNPVVPDSVLEKASACAMPGVLTYLVNNHRLLQANPIVFDTLLKNPAISASQTRQLEEYLKFGIVRDLNQEAVSDKELQDELTRSATLETEDDDFPEALALAADLSADEEPSVLSGVSHIEVEDDMDLSTYQKLLKMTVSEKIQRALKGNKEERSILIRDSNRTVALAVMASPKLTEQEVEGVAAMRNVHRDVLRTLGASRQFLKKYKTVLNLVKNPKVPQDISMGLLHRLTDKDLQLLTRDRTLSEFVRRSAQRILKGRKKN